jgi:hypothetical protein
MRIRAVVMAATIAISVLITAASPQPTAANAATNMPHQSASTSTSSPVVGPANPSQIIATHTGNTSNASLAPATSNGGYTLIDAWATGDVSAATSGSVGMLAQTEGIREQDGQFVGNHSLQDFIVWGTCVTNTDCSDQTTNPPALEITFSTGQSYCAAGLRQCFAVFVWRNGSWSGGANSPSPYVEASSGGIPDNGSWHPTVGQAYTLGYELSYGRINVTVNGSIVGYVPDSYWGQTTWGPVANEALQSEAFEANQNWGVEPYPSLDYDWSNFQDSAGDTIGTPNSGTGYVLSDESGSGYDISGGQTPSQAGTYWPVEASDDNSMCLGNYNDVASNGNKVVVWNCANPGAAQDWRFDSTTGELVNSNGYCLNDPADTTTNGTQLVIWECDGDAAQTWKEVLTGSAFTEFENVANGMCVDNPSNSTTNGEKAQVWSCLGDTAQQWDTPDF